MEISPPDNFNPQAFHPQAFRSQIFHRVTRKKLYIIANIRHNLCTTFFFPGRCHRQHGITIVLVFTTPPGAFPLEDFGWEGRVQKIGKIVLSHSVVTLSLPSHSGLPSSTNLPQFHLAPHYVLNDISSGSRGTPD